MRFLLLLVPLTFALVFVAQHEFPFMTQYGLKIQESRKASPDGDNAHLPEIIIYRRSKKTGSSSMLETLINVTRPYGYHTLVFKTEVLISMVRLEAHRAKPRRLLIAQHNRVTREHTNGRKTLIVDTFLDGFRQATSFCQFSSKASDCKESMIKCLTNPDVISNLNTYRWAGNREEDKSTFIDIPLSSAHPALSTTVFRYVFNNVTLDVGRFNVVGSACEETPALRRIYDKNYQPLTNQVNRLSSRLLSLAGYPIAGEGVTTREMLDAAEEQERVKYEFSEMGDRSSRGPSHAESTQASKRRWIKKNGKVVVDK